MKKLIQIYEWYLLFVCVLLLPFPFFIPHELLYLLAAVFISGLLIIIADLLFSNATAEEKGIWAVVLVLLNGLILPIYWFVYLRKRKFSYLLNKLEPNNAGSANPLTPLAPEDR